LVAAARAQSRARLFRALLAPASADRRLQVNVKLFSSTGDQAKDFFRSGGSGADIFATPGRLEVCSVRLKTTPSPLQRGQA
jgi:hypothetical protein